MTDFDPITLSVVWGGLLSAAADMGTTLLRTAYSMTVREGSDFSTAVFNADGDMVAQGDYSPGHLGSMAYTVRQMLKYYPKGTLEPDDAVICNDPSIGSGHLPDIFMVLPVFYDEELIGYTVSIAHHIDIGGSAPGSEEVVGVRDTYAEGIRIMPTRLFRRGQPNDDIMRVIEANVRIADVLGDLRAQYASIQVGAARLRGLAKQFGTDRLKACMVAILDQSEAAMRSAIGEIPSGSYHFEDLLDDVGPGTEPVHFKLALTVADGKVLMDWTGTSSQREAGLNAYLQYTRSYCIAAVKSVTLPRAPQNHGVIKCVEVVAPEGCYVNPKSGAASGARAVNSNRIYEVVMGALQQAVPERVVACGSGFVNPKIAGPCNPVNGRPYLAWLLAVGGTGALSYRDGLEATTLPTNGTNTPVEVQEMNAPVLVERMELIRDSGGAGKYRGGLALRKDVRLLAETGRTTNLGDRHKNPPFGFAGGLPGQLSATVLNPGGNRELFMESKGTYDLVKDDVISMRTAGASGYGNPFDREVDKVLVDVQEDYVSVSAAADQYGVCIDPATLTVNIPETKRLRAGRLSRFH